MMFMIMMRMLCFVVLLRCCLDGAWNMITLQFITVHCPLPALRCLLSIGIFTPYSPAFDLHYIISSVFTPFITASNPMKFQRLS